MIQVYTDGGCNLKRHGIGAWAFHAEHSPTDHVISMAGSMVGSTNNRMEMTAVIQALKWLKQCDIAEARIVSDSQYVLRGITEWSPKWVRFNWMTADRKPVANRDLWEELLALTEGLTLEYEHVRGHQGHPQNELVDTLCTKIMQIAYDSYDANPDSVLRDPGCPTKRA